MKRAKAYLILGALSLAVIVPLSLYVSDIRYALTNDGIGHILEVEHFLQGHGFARTPWGLQSPDEDYLEAAGFPLGYAVAILLTTYAGLSPTEGALWIARLSWALLLPAVVFACRPLVPFRFAVIIGLLTITSPAALRYGYGTNTDVLYTVLVCVSYGLLIRAFRSERNRALVSLAFFAGLIAGLSYVFRYAALAYLLAVYAGLAGTALLFREIWKKVFVAAGLFSGGLMLVALPLVVRNLFLVGDPQPWRINRGEYASLITSARVVVKDMLIDLAGWRAVGMLAWDALLFTIVSLPLAALFAYALRLNYRRADDATRLGITTGIAFVGSTSCMLIIAHTWSGLDPGDLLRHVFPYTWIIWLAAFWALCSPPTRIRLHTAHALGVLFLALHLTGMFQSMARDKRILEGMESVADAHTAIQRLSEQYLSVTPQLKLVLSQDDSLLRAGEHLPEDALIVSNHGTLLSYLLRRPVRNMTFTGLDPFTARAIALHSSPPSKRPLYLLIVPDNRLSRRIQGADWKALLTERLAEGYTVFGDGGNYLLLKAVDNTPRDPQPSV